MRSIGIAIATLLLIGNASAAWVVAFDDSAFTDGGAIYQTISAPNLTLQIDQVRYWTLDGRVVTVDLAAGLTSLQDVFSQGWVATGFETDRYKAFGESTGYHTNTLYVTDDDDIVPGGGRQVDYVNTPNGLITVGGADGINFADYGVATYDMVNNPGAVYKLEINDGSAVPEPMSMALAVSGGIIVFMTRRRFHRKTEKVDTI